ncbi:MAG: hypothetical protein K2G51_09665 [Lachnospiraceae bacterium]|nr:hypothetical protein [Lachnospiraceae bacterium]
MKKTVWTAVVAGALMAGGLGIRQGDQTAQNPQGYVDNAIDDIGNQAAEELKKALADEVSAFFKSDDLSKTLGVDSEGQARLEESIKTYISHYSMDEEKLSEAKTSLDTLLENAEGLSVEELQDKIEGIFKE